MYRRILVVQKSKILEALGYTWSIKWEVIHSKVKGIRLNGVTLEAVYKLKQSAVCIHRFLKIAKWGTMSNNDSNYFNYCDCLIIVRGEKRMIVHTLPSL